ncbi:SusD/RagB family nutrient-binding outer membrane lipoprotein [Sphingobacterium sp. MYb382]|uniref:SusD/RagB family nutrient-binding outer membrane lipoprotein n=1 Tax=Sphingobacterium sp. MYb382 TaxID=2745278 RepID=UPI0030A9B2D1
MKTKTILSKISVLLLLGGLSSSCSNFEDLNTDPTAANEQQVKPEYFLNNAIIGAQQDPHISERIFIIYWKNVARQNYSNGLNMGSDNDSYNSDYWRYLSEWLNNANTAIEIADKKVANGTADAYNENVKQVARIWRAYLLSELTDNFGPAPVTAFQGVNPTFDPVKDVYYYMIEELKDAQSKLNLSISGAAIKDYDASYGYNWEKWQRYANSMRMRLAMRMSEVDPAKAKTEFEAAVATNLYISNADQNFSVQEKDGWNPLAGVMSRAYTQMISATMNNLFIGLGGINTADQFTNADIKAKVKPANDMGIRYLNNFSTMSNDPSQGYYLDGLPNKMDPRAYKAFFLPGDVANPEYWSLATNQAATIKVSATRTDQLDTKYTWNSFSTGTWGAKASDIVLRGQNGRQPGMINKFRNSSQRRIFFASWESYYLIAEAALRGWATPMSDQAAYEQGVKDNFAYWGASNYVSQYLGSTDYNRAGTSVKYDHVTEPGATFTANYVDAYTGQAGTTQIAYPSNTIYKDGNVKNDKLTKIITQKYISAFPYLPLEAWSDHRRLGLPFFENPAVEQPMATMPQINASNYTKNQVNFFPQRLRYPSSFRNADPENYTKAVSLLEGTDDIFTPLWWAKKK